VAENELPQPNREFIARCVSGTTANPVLEQIREKGAEALLCVFRLIKIAQVHAAENDAVKRTVEQSHKILVDFAGVVGGVVSLTFSDDTVFVCGQHLCASRPVYQSAAELGGIFARCGASEFQVGGAVTPDELLLFTVTIAGFLRGEITQEKIAERRFANLALRQTDVSLVGKNQEEGLPVREQILRLYSSALVVMRKFVEGVAAGSTVLPFRLKRISQRLAGLAELEDPAFLGLMAMATAHRDDAGRAVHSAILAVITARQITSDRVVLANLAMTALLADTGRIRVAGPRAGATFLQLADNVEAAVPPLTSAIGLAMGGVNAATARRVVTSFETTWIERERMMGRVYHQKLAPLFETKLLYAVRQLILKLAPRDQSQALSPVDALAAVGDDPLVDPIVFKLLVKSVGLVPVGSVIELETGEWAVVVGPSADANAADRPKIRVVMDRGGRVIEPPLEVDLGRPTEGRTYPRIARIVEPSESRFNVARVFVG
jgi:hypothetical protein